MTPGKHGATKDNPLGGNIKKNRLWMKWCHLETNKVHDVREWKVWEAAERSVIQSPGNLDVNRTTALLLLPRPTNYVSKQVRFVTPLVTAPHCKIPLWRAAHKICNIVLEKYPRERITKDTNQDHHYGALDSDATDHFIPTTYHGTNHQDSVDVAVVNRCKRFTLDSTRVKLVQTMINS